MVLTANELELSLKTDFIRENEFGIENFEILAYGQKIINVCFTDFALMPMTRTQIAMMSPKVADLHKLFAKPVQANHTYPYVSKYVKLSA
ncbi:MAG: hypothetical protein U5L02_19485 [Rheinheimera sp.]|nr:hypothetical protein [Rheinheimera sp.]